MATYAQIESILASRLGNRGDLAASITLECQLAQETLERNWVDDPMPWWLVIEQRWDIADQLYQTDFSSHTAFIRFVDNGKFMIGLENSGLIFPIKRVSQEEIYSCLFDSDTGAVVTAGRPKYFSLTGMLLNVDKPVDGEHSFYYSCYEADTAWGTGTENGWSLQAPKLIIAEAGIALAKYVQNQKLEQQFVRERTEEYDRVLKASVAREMSAFEGEMGGAE